MISTHDRWPVLRETLESLLANGYPRLDVIVVDNASGDGTVERLAAEFPSVRRMVQKTNHALRGYNVGVEAATAPYVLILDDDASPQPGVIERMVEVLERYPGLGAAAAHVVDPSGCSEWGQEGGSDLSDTWWNLIGCGFLIRREVWVEAGGYDESFGLYYNDLALALRILARGKRIAYSRHWMVVHRKPAGCLSPFKRRMMLRNFPRICRRHFRRPTAARLVLGHGLILLRRTPPAQWPASLGTMILTWARTRGRRVAPEPLPPPVAEQFCRRFAFPECLLRAAGGWEEGWSPVEALHSVLPFVSRGSANPCDTGEVDLTPRPGLPPLRVPRVAAAVVTHNKREAALRLLDRLRASGTPAFVTANACSDGTPEAVRRQYPEVSLLVSERNLGGTGGFDAAILAALSTGAPYVALIDDDALPRDDCLRRLADFLDEHPGYSFAAPAVYLLDQPSVLQETGGRVDFRSSNPVEALHRFAAHPPTPRPFDVDYASACLLVVRAAAILKAGVMDWDWFLFFDDVDWCLKLRQAWGPGACVPTACALHDFPWAKPFSTTRLYYFHRNTLRLLARWSPVGVRRALRATLKRAYRALLMARAAGDRELAATLRAALRDARRQQWGDWKTPVPFPDRRRLFPTEPAASPQVRSVLLDFRVEEFMADAVTALRTRYPDLSVDALCDPRRAEAVRARGLFREVIERRPGPVGRLGQVLVLWRRRYDLVVSDAFIEPRGPTAMTGRVAAFYHQGSLWAADRRPVRTLLAAVLSPGLAAMASWLGVWRLTPRPAEGRPPPEAAPLLRRMGLDPDVGQPWARDGFLPFSVNPRDATLHRPGAGCIARRLLRRWLERLVPALRPPLYAARGQEDPGGFASWQAARTQAAPRRYRFSARRRKEPLFSILTPVCDPPAAWLVETLRSVRRQTFPDWELILADDASRSPRVRWVLRAAPLADRRIRSVRRKTRGGISVATHEAARLARGEYLVFLDHDDLLDRWALAAFARHLEQTAGGGAGSADVLYADEDRFDETQELFWPGFKPDFSPDRLLATNYIHHPVVMRRTLYEALGGLRSRLDGSQDHDLLLRAAEAGARFAHIPDILYHMRFHPGSLVARPEAKPQAYERDLAAIRESLSRRGVAARVVPLPGRPGLHRIDRTERFPGRVSVLQVGAGDRREGTPDWGDWEHLRGESSLSIPEQINALARRATGDILLITADDLDAGGPETVAPLVVHAARPDLGLVTGKVVHPDGTVCSCGLVLGIAGATGRWHHGCRADDPSYGAWLEIAHEVSAVPWRFFAVKKDVFLEVGGMDTAFREQGFDVDLALRLRDERSLRSLVIPWVKVRRLQACSDELEAWPAGDLARLWDQWGTILRRGDPCFNPNLSLLSEKVLFVDGLEDSLRARGVFMAYDAPTAALLGRRFGR